MDAGEERRQYTRLNLMRPLDGWFGDYAVRLLDVSASGAMVDLEEPIEIEARALLRFFWQGVEVEILAEIARANDKRLGLRFIEESETLDKLLAASVTEILHVPNFIFETPNAALIARPLTFTTWSYDGTAWKQRPSLMPDQPNDGFTIAAQESAEQVAVLCRTYQHGDDEAKRLTRLLAELSVKNARMGQ